MPNKHHTPLPWAIDKCAGCGTYEIVVEVPIYNDTEEFIAEGCNSYECINADNEDLKNFIAGL
jgi:hypothetical protein